MTKIGKTHRSADIDQVSKKFTKTDFEGRVFFIYGSFSNTWSYSIYDSHSDYYFHTVFISYNWTFKQIPNVKGFFFLQKLVIVIGGDGEGIPFFNKCS